MPNLNSLVTQPQSPEPPDVQGKSGTGGDSGLPMQHSGAPQGAAGGFQFPNHHETVAVLQHIGAFIQRWQQILKDPGIGKENVRGQVLDMMSDMIADDYVSLPQTMEFLKTMPTDPLEQKQWIEGHIQKDEQARAAIIEHFAQGAGPIGDATTAMATLQENGGDRSELVNGVIGRYKAHKNKPQRMSGVPIRA